jgi:hypothetical protein
MHARDKLPYFPGDSVARKSFLTLTLFSSPLIKRSNKPDYVPGKSFQSCLTFASVASEKGILLLLLANVRSGTKVLKLVYAHNLRMFLVS